MANWIYPRETLELMPTILLQELIVGSPLKNECHQKVDQYVKTEREILLSTVEKYRCQNKYKTALEQFKRLTINPDGSKAKANMEIRECKERKEQLYRLYKQEMNRLKLLEEQYNAEVIIAGEAQQRYWSSMENAIETILWQRNNQRWIEIRRQRREEMMETQIILPSLKEEYEYLTLEQLEEPMEDVCIICMESHPIKETLLTCCDHRFGTECFKAWHKQRATMKICVNCPMCKNEKDLSVTKYKKIKVVDLVC
jgi:hypothetical protein